MAAPALPQKERRAITGETTLRNQTIPQTIGVDPDAILVKRCLKARNWRER